MTGSRSTLDDEAEVRQPPKVTRVAMTILFEDGRVIAWEARDPGKVTLDFDRPPWTLQHVRDAAPDPDRIPSPPVTAITARIEAGRTGYDGFQSWAGAEAERASLQPSIAENAARWIEDMPVYLGPLRVLLPYLWRVAGRRY